MLACIFPGQGSQKKGMGEGLFDQVPEYRDVAQQVDDVLGYSLRQLCLQDPENKLRDTRYTQPALFVVNALTYYKGRAQGTRPAMLAGHSLGEYDALLAAGVFDLLTGLRLVRMRGELMSRARKGGMAAVVGLSESKIAQVLREYGLSGVDVANFNSPSQIVVSGLTEDIARAGPIFEKAGARLYMPLPVSAPFHSRHMEDAARAYGAFLAGFGFSAPRLPVVANVTAEPYPSSSDAIKSLLVQQIARSVRWTQSVRYMHSRGVSEFNEMGPGNVLTRLVAQIPQEAVA